MSESTEDTSTDSKFKVGISVWLSICVFVCLWFLSRFVTGRRQLRSNLHVIEDGLKRMQEEIEKRQRENSIGYGENLEELMEELLKKDKNETTEEQKEEEANSPTEKKEGKEVMAESEEVLIQDKKND